MTIPWTYQFPLSGMAPMPDPPSFSADFTGFIEGRGGGLQPGNGALGLRERKTGAGRKPSAEALALWAHSQRQYGPRALRVLRAAYRAGKAQQAAPELIPAPQLEFAGGGSVAARGSEHPGAMARQTATSLSGILCTQRTKG